MCPILNQPLRHELDKLFRTVAINTDRSQLYSNPRLINHTLRHELDRLRRASVNSLSPTLVTRPPCAAKRGEFASDSHWDVILPRATVKDLIPISDAEVWLGVSRSLLSLSLFVRFFYRSLFVSIRLFYTSLSKFSFFICTSFWNVFFCVFTSLL